MFVPITYLTLQVIEIPHLYCVETIHNAKLATAFDNAVGKAGREGKLKVFVQINTSEEESK